MNEIQGKKGSTISRLTDDYLLKVIDLEAGYDKRIVLNGVSLGVNESEIVGLVGPNGSGKSTILKAIFGLLKGRRGRIVFKGQEIRNRKPTLNIKGGIGFIPQGSRVFTELSVLENLEVGGYLLNGKDKVRSQIEKIFKLFPILKERKSQNAGNLSGGEKQMLALGRVLMLQTKLLLLDEPSLGLSPTLVKVALRTIREIREEFKTAILIVEQNVKEVLGIADRVYVMKLGKIVLHDTPQNLSQGDRIRKVYLS